MANRTAQDTVERAITKWGRFNLVVDPQTAHLIIAVRKGSRSGPVISHSPLDDRPPDSDRDAGRFRAVNEVIGVAGFVLPGTRVDVLLTGNPSGGNEEQTTTVLENVEVIATGQLERNPAGEPQTTPVITLLVSPDDAQKLTLASTQGRIRLALRNPQEQPMWDTPLKPIPRASTRLNASTPPIAFTVGSAIYGHFSVTGPRDFTRSREDELLRRLRPPRLMTLRKSLIVAR